MTTHPELATAIGDNRFNDRLSDYSPAAFAREAEHARKALAEFKQVDAGALNEADQLNRALMVRRLETQVASERFKEWEMPVDQMNGPHIEYAGMAEDMPFQTVHDYENYVSRLKQLPRVLMQVMGNMRLGMHDHLMPPRYLLEKVVEEANDVANKPVDQSLFTTPLKHFPASFSADDRQRITAALSNTVSKQVLPAYAQFGRFVKNDYAPNGRKDYGLWSLPDGAARYRQAIREQTTTDRSQRTAQFRGKAGRRD